MTKNAKFYNNSKHTDFTSSDPVMAFKMMCFVFNSLIVFTGIWNQPIRNFAYKNMVYKFHTQKVS